MPASAGRGARAGSNGGPAERAHAAIGAMQSGDDTAPGRQTISGARIHYAELQLLAHVLLQARCTIPHAPIRREFRFHFSVAITLSAWQSSKSLRNSSLKHRLWKSPKCGPRL